MSDKLRLKAYEGLMPMVAAHLHMPAVSGEDPDGYLPYLERMRREGCSVVLKVDGPRPGKNQYTAAVRIGPLGAEGGLRTDAPSLSTAMAYIVVEYARARWGFTQ